MSKEKVCLIVLIICLIFILITILTLSLKSIIYDIKYLMRVDAIMADKFEIEKKWLIDKDKIPYDLSKTEVIEIEQTYISFSPEIRVRRIDKGEEYTFAVKTNMTSDRMIRDEMKNSITEEEYNKMIKKREGNTIKKTRYQFLDGDYVLATDIFSGDLEGLAYLEIEFENEEQANSFKEPNWIIKDVTADLNYKNGHLARYGIPESYFDYIK